MKSKTHALFGATMLMTVTVDLEGKRKRTATEHVKAWVDPEGCRRFIASKRRAFEDEVDAEMGAAKAPEKK
jgi:metallo-beta-lactamase class B